MKHRISIVLTVCSLLFALVSVAAAPMRSGSAVLAGVDYVLGKGPVFTFHVSGDFSKSDLKGGTVHVNGGGSYDLHCVRVDDSTVKCTAPKAVAGQDVSVTWGGSTAWTHVPPAQEAAQQQYCYDIYDWVVDPDAETLVWDKVSTYCQTTPAKYGDTITWYNPFWNDEDEYDFLPENPDKETCTDYHAGDAYYYWTCWSSGV